MSDVLYVSVIVSRDTDLVSNVLHRSELAFSTEQEMDDYRQRLEGWLDRRPVPVLECIEPDVVQPPSGFDAFNPLEAELDRILNIFQADGGPPAPPPRPVPFDQEAAK